MFVKALWLATLLTVALMAPASAETVKIPSDDPFVTIQVPDNGWTVTQIDKGVEVESDDDEVYIAVEATPMKGLVELTVDAVRFLNAPA
jgi:hypothetical protein